MCVRERCCSPRGFCAYEDGDRGCGSWHLFPGALQSIKQSRGLVESALPPVLYPSSPVPFLPSPGASSHLSSLPVGGPPARKTAASLPDQQASRSLVPQTQLPGQPGSALPCPCRRTTSSDGPSCHQGLGAPVLAVPGPSVLTSCPREPVLTVCSCKGRCCFKGHEVLKPGAQVGGHWKQELGRVLCHLPSVSSAVCPIDPGQQA